MGLSTQGKVAVLVACAAAALSPAATAAAAPGGAGVPLDVPLQGLDGMLPGGAPTLGGSLPSNLLAPPAAPRIMDGEQVTVPLVPELVADARSPELVAKLPVAGADRLLEPTVAGVLVQSRPLLASTPAADLALPLTNPGASASGLPRLALPDATITTPSAQGEGSADVGVADQG